MNTLKMNQLLDEIDEGLVYLNDQQEIVLFNEKAKEITGISLKTERYHDAGRVEKGDLVVLITNRFGVDDGPLTPEALEPLNCKIQNLEIGDALVAVGIYGHLQIHGIYKIWKQSELLDNMEMRVVFLGNKISALVNQVDKTMSIAINGIDITQSYVKAYGHIVVMDGDSGQIKFFQDKGYTIRRESIQDLLAQKKYLAKGIKSEKFNVIGKNLTDLFESDKLFEHLNQIYEQHEHQVYEQHEHQINVHHMGHSPIQFFMDVNHRPMICNLNAIYENEKFEGVLIKFRDLSEMSGLLMERNEILRSIEQLSAQSNLEDQLMALDHFSALIGTSNSIRQVKYLANRATEIKSNVLITGESGTGKTFLAKLIHEHMPLKGPFIEVNCAAIPQTLFESELFGYERGAFTGADQKGRKGYFEMANGGTLFLDEIGEIPLEVQVKLLQVLQSRRFFKVGSSVATVVDVRVITATNRPLFEAVKNGRFREDLYYRINVFPIHMPALRERRADLYLIISDVMKKLSSRLEIKEKQLSGEAFSRLLRYSWYGNIRELENVLERAIAVSKTSIIYPEHIQMIHEDALTRSGDYTTNQSDYATNQSDYTTNQGDYVTNSGDYTTNSGTYATTSGDYWDGYLKDQMDAFERELLIKAIQSTGNNKEAMSVLGLSKSTFYDKLKKHQIEGVSE